MTFLHPQLTEDADENILFRFIDIEPMICCLEKSSGPTFAETYILLLATKGNCTLIADNQRFALEQGRCFLISPGMLLEFELNGSVSPDGFYITFEALSESARIKEERIFQMSAHVFDCDVEIPKNYFRELQHLAVLLNDSRELPAELRKQSDLLSFYKLVYRLMDIAQAKHTHDNDSRYAIMQTIREMERRYAEPLTRDELAGIACMSPWYYSHLFKATIGLSPHRYLSDIRIKQAKELLRKGIPSREVALKVGYSDDSHFRRKFREAVGMPPSVFAARKYEKIATVSYHYAAHLFALDIVPYVAPVDREREYHRSHYHDLIPVHLLRGKTMPAEIWRHNMQCLAQAKPEIILCDEIIPPEIEEQLHKIAPTFVIPWMSNHWRDQFRQIAVIFGKEKEVERWINEYEHKADEAGAAVHQFIGDETVTLLHIMLGKLIIYGRRNGGAVLYEDLHLKPACDTIDIPVYRVLSASELSQLRDTDHLLIVVDRDKASQLTWAQLQKDTAWKTIRAVRRGQIHRIDETPWLEYSPFAHELVLQQAQQLFAK